MRIAQQLYEGVDLSGEGRVGLITYMRTDSSNIAETALREIAEVVRTGFGPEYVLAQPRRYKTRVRGAQEAHEAIRPTSALRTPDRVAAALDRNQQRLYRLIWQRTVACQMAEARFKQLSVDIRAKAEGAEVYGLRATGQTLLFDGFRRVYFEGRDDAPDEDAESMLPRLTAEQVLRMLEVLPEQHFTQPPPRFTEASLVKMLEELGIGRPSTYASTLSTIQDRGYVRLEDRRFYPEDVGEVVTDLLVDFFPDIVDHEFTAKMEEELDEIAEGNLGWVQVLDEFYGPFERLIEKNVDEIQRFEEQLDELCPRCPVEGREPGHLVVKLGRYGKFIGCDKYPECTYIRNLDGTERPEPELLDETCPECGRRLQRRSGRFGPFVGCSGYPECRYIKREPPKSTGVICPQCHQGQLVEKKTRFGIFYGCDRYPDCSLGVNNPPIPDTPCPECGSLLLKRPTKGPRCWNCGAELDDDLNVVKPGDPEAEAAARAAKAAAREARAAVRTKKTAAKKTAAKKTAAKKTAAKRTATKKSSTASSAPAGEAEASSGEVAEA
jgi:DNA topoisomerase-1